MHGFYANLLTKNVAMGGNVEGSAVSAYTAGSQRNAHMGSGPAADRDNSAAQIRSSSDVPDVSSKRKYDSDDGQHESGKATDSTITSSSSSSSRNDSMGTSKAARLEAENIVSEDVLNITSGQDIIVDPVEDVSEAVAVIAPSKAEIISSARQRFLDRKLASSS